MVACSFGIGGSSEPTFEVLDGVRHTAHEEVVRTRVERLAGHHHLTRELVADDLHVRPVDLIAMRMIEVIVAVDDEANGLGGDGLQFLTKRPRATRSDVRVHDQDIPVALDDGGVGHDHQVARADGVPDALLDLVERKCLAGVRGAWRPAGVDLLTRRSRTSE